MPGDYFQITTEDLLDLLSKETLRYNQAVLSDASKEELKVLRHELKAMLLELEKRRMSNKSKES